VQLYTILLTQSRTTMFLRRHLKSGVPLKIGSE
jgi:hypothetical protein